MTAPTRTVDGAAHCPHDARPCAAERSRLRHPLAALLLVVAVHVGAVLALLAVAPAQRQVDRAQPAHILAAQLIARVSSVAPAPMHPSQARAHPAMPHASAARPIPARTTPALHPPPAVAPRPVPAPDPTPAAPRGRNDDSSMPPVADPTAGAAASPSQKSAESVGGASSSVPKSVAHLACAIAKPAYPALSRRMRETGTVLVELIVAATGRVESASIAETSGHERLDEAAREAVAASTCSPYLESGVAFRVAAKVPVTFNLND
ncbi:MAG: energy transducer TonB [Paraburkholderia sp.]|nr:MAG: energy transducer TonB [Paraburkholderia sp.]